MTLLSLEASYRQCRGIAWRSARNFFYAFPLLPRRKRLAMYALYAYLRHTDDLGDGPLPAGIADDDATRFRLLESWRDELNQTLDGGHTDSPVLLALADTVTRFSIPRQHLEAAIDGVEMDLEGREYATFSDLEVYCHRVASSVGLACIHIWGFHGQDVFEPAQCCGLAFQLTNILRDLKEDAERGRIYLPQEDLERFGYSPEELRHGVRNAAFKRLMEFEIARTEDLYARGRVLSEMLSPDGARCFEVMLGVYSELLAKIRRRQGDVFSARVRVSPWRKLRIVAGTLAPRPSLRRLLLGTNS